MPYDLSACGRVTVSELLVQESNATDGKGVILRNGDMPMITRGWDCFTSGPKTGIGRWGLFMEAAETFLAAPGTDYTTGKVGLGGYLVDGTKQNTLTATTDTRRVGIGTMIPAFALDVCAPVNNQGIRINSVQAAALYLYSTYNDASNRNWGIYNNSNVFGDFDIRQSNTKDGDMTVGANATSRLYIKNDGKVGIGTQSPKYSLDIAGGAMSNFYMSCCNTTIDSSGPFDYGIIGTGNIAGALIINDIVGARYSIHGGNYNLTFRKSVRGTTTACSYCTVMQFVGALDTNCVTNVSITHRLGIGTTSPSYGLHVNGTFYAAGSSCEYKTSICQYNTDSCMFMKLTPVTYQYKDEYTHLGKELKSVTQIGLIAEDVAEVYPELAILVNEDDQKIVRNVDYEKLSIVLLSEVQKLRKELDELKTK